MPYLMGNRFEGSRQSAIPPTWLLPRRDARPAWNLYGTGRRGLKHNAPNVVKEPIIRPLLGLLTLAPASSSATTAGKIGRKIAEEIVTMVVMSDLVPRNSS